VGISNGPVTLVERPEGVYVWGFQCTSWCGGKRSVRGGGIPPDAAPFNLFIDDNLLIDMSLCGRRYTWFKGDGMSMSRIDQFLLTEEWCI
jgi:hypothetical protein